MRWPIRPYTPLCLRWEIVWSLLLAPWCLFYAPTPLTTITTTSITNCTCLLHCAAGTVAGAAAGVARAAVSLSVGAVQGAVELAQSATQAVLSPAYSVGTICRVSKATVLPACWHDCRLRFRPAALDIAPVLRVHGTGMHAACGVAA